MDNILSSKLGKLKIICSLPLFSDSICIRRQSAAEHGYTQIIFSMILAPHLKLSVENECNLIELAIFSEMPKVFLGDPSFYLRQRHTDVKDVYNKIKGRLWQETEESLGVETSRNASLYGLHELTDSFAAMLFIEKECLLGNQFFAFERLNSYYNHKRKKALALEDLAKEHPCSTSQNEKININWKSAVELLDDLFNEANAALKQGGLPEYSSTFLGMTEKLKEHFRYKGWNYHYRESVGEHTFQVTFLSYLIAKKLDLPAQEKIALYHMATLHDLAEAYASDVVYPVKIREKEVGDLHQKIEEEVIEKIRSRFNLSWSTSPLLNAIVDICDRFSSQIYFDRERRSGNTHFNVPNTSMIKTREKYLKDYPKVFECIDALWEEYTSVF